MGTKGKTERISDRKLEMGLDNRARETRNPLEVGDSEPVRKRCFLRANFLRFHTQGEFFACSPFFHWTVSSCTAQDGPAPEVSQGSDERTLSLAWV